jgi:PAS domain S-box-containing protein
MPSPPPFPDAHNLHRLAFPAPALMGVAAAAVIIALLLALHHQTNQLLLLCSLTALGTLAIFHGRSLVQLQSHFHRSRLSLANNQHAFRSLFDGSLDAIMILDDRLVCTAANSAAAELLGIDRRQLIGRSMDKLAPGSTRILHRRNSGSSGHSRRGRMELIRGDGTCIEAEFSSSAMEAPGCHLLVLRDTSALARAEETKNRALVVAHRRLVKLNLCAARRWC